MLVSFTDSYYELLYTGGKITGKPRFPPEVIKLFRLRIDQIKNSQSTQELRNFKSLRFEKLEPKNAPDPVYSIRVNDQYRLEFNLDNNGKIEIVRVFRMSDHYSK
jgi:plasmid maintenance system killer protein